MISDTSSDALAVQIELLRKASLSDRFCLTCELTTGGDRAFSQRDPAGPSHLERTRSQARVGGVALRQGVGG